MRHQQTCRIVHLLLCFMRLTRTINWLMHIQCLQKMLPWMAPYDRTNNARYVPLYILDMLQVPETHTDIHNRLMAGEFLVQLTKGRMFSSIPHDQTIEVTINNDTKTSGGLVEKTLRHASVNKCIWTAADKAKYYQVLLVLYGCGRFHFKQGWRNHTCIPRRRSC